jgi:bifunctional ADP-heptose synthase (sugar kinase/adenylyltransferase)
MSHEDVAAYSDSFRSEALTRTPVVEPTAELDHYLEGFRTEFGFGDVTRYLEGASALRVLAVGEAIIDEYEYCETIGKSGKEPILAARYVSRDRFAGGVLAVANQLGVAAREVAAITYLGATDSQEDFIRSRLRNNVRLQPILLNDAPTIVKRRFVEIYPLQKLFELYVMDGHDGESSDETRLCHELERILPAVDVVVVVDSGHGMLREEAVELLCASAPFLAINTQMNADNRGFNTVSKYRRADFVSVSEHELRLEARSRHRDLRGIVEDVAARLDCASMLVTRGQRGCVAFDREAGYVEVPAFTSAVVDRIGAGDAVLSLGALLAAQGAPARLTGLVANAVGAVAVGVVGNKSVVELEPLVAELKGVLA